MKLGGLLALVTAAVVTTGCGASEPPPVSEQVQQYYNENVAGAKATVAPSQEAVRVSVLSDSHAFNADSWWRQTVAAGRVEGAQLGAFESQPGADSATLQGRVAAASTGGGYVVVQAGTNDLLAWATPDEALSGITALWDAVVQAGAKPVAALVPPSADRSSGTVALNGLIRSTAASREIPVLDLYTPVANMDGTWKEGLSTDGVHSDRAGSDLMAAAAAEQLAAIVRP